MRPLRIVNVFTGKGTWVAPFRDGGHEVWTSDIEPQFETSLTSDILDLRLSDIPWGPGQVDVFLASPDCTAFSKASIGKHWGGGFRGYMPKTDKARNRMALVFKVASLIEALRPRVAVVENPVGMLRKLKILDRYERRTVWYCHYAGDAGKPRAKPTDLWGAPFPKYWLPKPECHNRRPEHPADCCCQDHEAAPRGAKTGTQGLEKQARSAIPYELANHIRFAIEVQAREERW